MKVVIFIGSLCWWIEGEPYIYLIVGRRIADYGMSCSQGRDWFLVGSWFRSSIRDNDKVICLDECVQLFVAFIITKMILPSPMW